MGILLIISTEIGQIMLQDLENQVHISLFKCQSIQNILGFFKLGIFFLDLFCFQLFSGKEFWLGLEHLYHITKDKPLYLRVEVVDQNGMVSEQYYSHFHILDNVSFCHCLNLL